MPSRLLESPPNYLHLSTAVCLAIARGGKIDDPHVNADEFVHHQQRVFGYVTSGVQEEMPVAVDEINLAFESGKSSLLILTEDIVDEYSAREC